MMNVSRKRFLGGITAAAAMGGGGCVSALAEKGARTAVPADDWRPSVRWRGVNLLGMFRCPSIGLKPDPRIEGHFVEWEFQALRDWGFNFARLPLDYRILIAEDNWLELDERKMKHLDDAIEWGRRHGIHVQIALHRIPGYCILDRTEPFPLGTSPVAQEAACRMWAAFAKRWKGVPNENLSFNLFNEPTRHTAGTNYLPLCLKLIKAIRDVDAERFIMADGNACASMPVPGLYGLRSVGQAFRGYTPHALTHYGADFLGGLSKAPPTWPLAPGYGRLAPEYGGNLNRRRELPEATVAKYQGAIDAGEFCMVGEFGCRPDVPHDVALAWMEHCLKLWKEKNLGWALWNLRGTFGILDSGRRDVRYEDFNGHKLDRKMLELLKRY